MGKGDRKGEQEVVVAECSMCSMLPPAPPVPT